MSGNVVVISNENIMVHFKCPECQTKIKQSLDDISIVGTAFCTECDTEMDMEGNCDVKLDY